MATAEETFDEIKAAMGQGEFKRATEMIEQALAADSQFAQGRNIDLANWLVLGANWSLIDRLLPKHTNSLVTGGWLNSLVQNRPADAKGAALPWLTYAAIVSCPLITEPRNS